MSKSIKGVFFRLLSSLNGAVWKTSIIQSQIHWTNVTCPPYSRLYTSDSKAEKDNLIDYRNVMFTGIPIWFDECRTRFQAVKILFRDKNILSGVGSSLDFSKILFQKNFSIPFKGGSKKKLVTHFKWVFWHLLRCSSFVLNISEYARKENEITLEESLVLKYSCDCPTYI